MPHAGSRPCCLCGADQWSYNNPDPLRNGELDCCDTCNLLVREARRRACLLPSEEYKAYVLRLQGMSYAELVQELGDVQEG